MDSYDDQLGACRANRENCKDLGPWRPFYQGYVCSSCLLADQADVMTGKRPEWWARYD